MAKIIKVGSQNLTPHKIANPFRTSRNSTTNPFKYSDFEGNTLPLELAADVFQINKSSKMKLVASSVAGTMDKIKSSIPESIINFVNRITSGVSSAWKYAKETTFTHAMSDAAKATTDILNTEIHINLPQVNLPHIKGLSDKMSGLKDGISSRMDAIHEGAVSMRDDLHAKWDNLIAKIPSRTKYTANTPVEELEKAWLEINAMEVAA